jgi:hypothetical protein
MEGILESMGDVLRQHTSCWATARSMLEKLESLASPTVIVGGQAFLKGLQNGPTPQMGALLLHMLSNLPKELGSKLSKIRQVITRTLEYWYRRTGGTRMRGPLSGYWLTYTRLLGSACHRYRSTN